MIEFGSDFHFIPELLHASNNRNFPESKFRFFANGRHAIEALILQEKWHRIWVPAYFCYEVVASIAGTGIQIMLYDDYPLNNDDDNLLSSLQFKDSDVLLRVNYFGLRDFRSNKRLPVPVIEDHTHDLISRWATNSDAKWCVASVRKTLPVAAGGILWSPVNACLPKQPSISCECESMSIMRYEAMKMKSAYLNHGGNKTEFRKKYISSEYVLDSLQISGMDTISCEIACNIDLAEWTSRRKDNWEYANMLLKSRFNVLQPPLGVNPFSLVIYFEDSLERDRFRNYLINHNIYPAILWRLPNESLFADALDFSRRIISIHCDARYNRNDIEKMCSIINSYYD